MDKKYFVEKTDLALEFIFNSVTHARDASRMIDASSYELPNLTDPGVIHETLKIAQSHIISARRNFEKSRWAAAHTELEFEDWLRANGHDDLCI